MPFQSSLRFRLLALLTGCLLVVIAIGLACFRYLAHDIREYQDLLGGPMSYAQGIDETNLEFKSQVQEWKNVLLRGKDPAALTKYWEQFEQQEQKVATELAELQRQMRADGQSELASQVQSLADEHQRLGTAYRQGKQQFLAAGADPYAGDKAVKGIDRATSEQLSALVKQLHKDAIEQSATIAKEASATMVTGTLVLLICALLVTLLGLWLVNRQILIPLQELTTHVTRFAQGEFSHHLSWQRQDELGLLQKAADTLRDSLVKTFSHIRLSTSELDSTSSGLQQISRQLATSTQEQFAKTDQLATAMHEMAATAGNVADNAASAAQAAEEADHAASEGEAVMQTTINTINGMSQEIDNTASVIHQLDEDSRRISTVLEVIRNIAEQTNLLALNAAIEAARAGEQGRGFAVVADEVRTLARRTADSTAEINKIIDMVLSGTQNAVDAIGKGRAFSSESVDQVAKAGSMLQRITSAIGEIHSMNQQIATAAEQQTSVAEEISRNLTDIKEIATGNNQDAERTLQASQQLHTISSALSQHLQQLSA